MKTTINRRVAMAVRSYNSNTGNPGDYHFLMQCSDGTWSHKLGWLNSYNLGNINPEIIPWNYGGINPSTQELMYGLPYDQGTIYYAVRVW